MAFKEEKMPLYAARNKSPKNGGKGGGLPLGCHDDHPASSFLPPPLIRTFRTFSLSLSLQVAV